MPERTLALIKPDAIASGNAGAVISMIECAGLAICAQKMFRLSRQQAAAFYSSHRGKSFYEPLIYFMVSGPLIAMVLESPDAISTWRGLIGPTDSRIAPEGTIRKTFGTDARLNAVHGSDSPESAAKEIAFFFSEESLLH